MSRLYDKEGNPVVQKRSWVSWVLIVFSVVAIVLASYSLAGELKTQVQQNSEQIHLTHQQVDALQQDIATNRPVSRSITCAIAEQVGANVGDVCAGSGQ